jgi:hypothetical protein
MGPELSSSQVLSSYMLLAEVSEHYQVGDVLLEALTFL